MGLTKGVMGVSENLFTGTEHIFRDVIFLAENIELKHEQADSHGSSIGEIIAFDKTPAGQEIEKATVALTNYLLTLSFDNVKMLQRVMYLGRDREYDEHLVAQMDIYNDFLRTFRKSDWETKEVEAKVMVQKGNLARYLKDGAKILSIQL